MAKVLIIGSQREECDALALVLEFAGHRCDTASSLQEALRRNKQENYEVLLADSFVDHSSEEMLRELKGAAPKATVMILSEDAPRRDEEVLTHPFSPVHNLSEKFSNIGQDAAFLVLLPEQDSIKMLKDVPNRAGLLNKLAVLYHSQEKYEAAEHLYKRALKAAEKPLLKRALSTDEKQAKDDNRAAASIMNNLARLYHDQRQYNEAEPLYKRSLAMVEKLYGPDHAKVAQRLSNLIELYRAQGLNDKAIEMDMRLKSIGSSTRH